MSAEIYEFSDFEADEASLMARVQSCDTEAFVPLVRRHLPLLRSFVASRLPVSILVDEITHETFVFAFRRIAEFDVQKPFRPWLGAIA
jgi:DNA-directed RNA polymerase specialized sigma24 family protein